MVLNLKPMPTNILGFEKKSLLTNRLNLYTKITTLLESINTNLLNL